MILLNFDTWNSKHGYFLSWRRIYRKGKWTPFCRIGRRYDSWRGYWKKPKSVSWTLHDDVLIFNGIPSDAQEQTLIGLLKTFGLIPTGNTRASDTTYELFFEPAPILEVAAGESGELRFLYDEEVVLTFTEGGLGATPSAELYIDSAGSGEMGTTTPAVRLELVDDGRLTFPSSQCPSTCLHAAPLKTPIHIVIGEDEFTDKDIRLWAKGSFTRVLSWQAPLLIEYLSQIIVEQVLCN